MQLKEPLNSMQCNCIWIQTEVRVWLYRRNMSIKKRHNKMECLITTLWRIRLYLSGIAGRDFDRYLWLNIVTFSLCSRSWSWNVRLSHLFSPSALPFCLAVSLYCQLLKYEKPDWQSALLSHPIIGPQITSHQLREMFIITLASLLITATLLAILTETPTVLVHSIITVASI